MFLCHLPPKFCVAITFQSSITTPFYSPQNTSFIITSSRIPETRHKTHWSKCFRGFLFHISSSVFFSLHLITSSDLQLIPFQLFSLIPLHQVMNDVIDLILNFKRKKESKGGNNYKRRIFDFYAIIGTRWFCFCFNLPATNWHRLDLFSWVTQESEIQFNSRRYAIEHSICLIWNHRSLTSIFYWNSSWTGKSTLCKLWR